MAEPWTILAGISLRAEVRCPSCTVEVCLEELDKPVIDVIWDFKMGKFIKQCRVGKSCRRIVSKALEKSNAIIIT